jgi:hypothetical protein
MDKLILKANNSTYTMQFTKVIKTILTDYLTSLNLTKQDELPKPSAEPKTNKVYSDPFPASVILLTACCLVFVLIMLVFGVIYLINRERKSGVKPICACADSKSKSNGDDVLTSQSEQTCQDFDAKYAMIPFIMKLH